MVAYKDDCDRSVFFWKSNFISANPDNLTLCSYFIKCAQQALYLGNSYSSLKTHLNYHFLRDPFPDFQPKSDDFVTYFIKKPLPLEHLCQFIFM